MCLDTREKASARDRVSFAIILTPLLKETILFRALLDTRSSLTIQNAVGRYSLTVIMIVSIFDSREKSLTYVCASSSIAITTIWKCCSASILTTSLMSSDIVGSKWCSLAYWATSSETCKFLQTRRMLPSSPQLLSCSPNWLVVAEMLSLPPVPVVTRDSLSVCLSIASPTDHAQSYRSSRAGRYPVASTDTFWTCGHISSQGSSQPQHPP